jgi:hypothetical protein
LKKGIAEAELGIQHPLSLFHTLFEALRVEKGLLRAAYQAIKKEAERKQVMEKAKSETVFFKRWQQWEKAAITMDQQIDVYEMYRWLVSELREGVEFVSAAGALWARALRSRQEMEAQIQVIATLMQEIPHTSVQRVAERLQRQKGELVKSLEPLQEEFATLTVQVGDPEWVRLCRKRMAIGKGDRVPPKRQPLGNLPQAIAWLEGGSRQTGPKDCALALGASGAGIEFGRDRQQLAQTRNVATQGEWTRTLQLASVVLSVRIGSFAGSGKGKRQPS